MGKLFAVSLCVILAVAAPAAGKPKPKPKPKPKAPPAYDCMSLMPVSQFNALTGGSFTFDNYQKYTATLQSECSFGQNQLTIGVGQGTAAFFSQYVAGATQDTARLAPTCTGQADLRDCKLTTLTGFGKQAVEFNRTITVLASGNALVGLLSTDRSLTYAQMEAVVQALLTKVK